MNISAGSDLRCAAWKSSSHFRYGEMVCPTSSVIDDILLLFPLDLSDESPLLSVPPPAADLFLATDAEEDVAGGGGVNDDR